MGKANSGFVAKLYTLYFLLFQLSTFRKTLQTSNFLACLLQTGSLFNIQHPRHFTVCRKRFSSVIADVESSDKFVKLKVIEWKGASEDFCVLVP
ncbi:hypothetical protein SDC9_44742 [bioreactor metagenome]|uniref:Uncharacterized protein n=1 Tax=bioreactor metagenome TaxID=1076179 RepID=A0A644W4U8_9ZZZZ